MKSFFMQIGLTALLFIQPAQGFSLTLSTWWSQNESGEYVEDIVLRTQGSFVGNEQDISPLIQLWIPSQRGGVQGKLQEKNPPMHTLTPIKTRGWYLEKVLYDFNPPVHLDPFLPIIKIYETKFQSTGLVEK